MFLNSEKANQKGVELHSEGASFVELGAQSSNIQARQVGSEEEWNRIEPVLNHLKLKKIPISLDSFRPDVIQKSIQNGIKWINDITAGEYPGLMDIYMQNKDEIETLILMFSRDRSEKASSESKNILNPKTIKNEMIKFFDKKMEIFSKNGFNTDKIMIDPGMGFFLGEDPELSLQAIRACDELKKRYNRVFVSVSRKSFIGNILGGIPPQERTFGTLSAELELFELGVEAIRTHNVLALQQGIQIKKAIYPDKYLF